tara:strand:- start:12 stop:722 length:711 start_codon:yes stop_codon:yes gene_type:complete
MSSDSALKHQKFQNGMLVAQSFQMSKMNQGLSKLSESINVNSQLQMRAIQIQSDIKEIANSQLVEAKKNNELKRLEIEKADLIYQQDKAEKEYIRFQRNLAFEIKNSVEDIESQENTNMEKFLFLQTSESLFAELDTERFEISEMEYARDAYKSILKSKKKYEDLLNTKDKKDLKTIINIEEVDENKLLISIENDLKKLKVFHQSINKILKLKLKSKNPKVLKDALNKIIKEIKKQ